MQYSHSSAGGTPDRSETSEAAREVPGAAGRESGWTVVPVMRATSGEVDPIVPAEGPFIANVATLGIGSVPILSLEVDTDSGPIEVIGHDQPSVIVDAIDHDSASAEIDLRVRGDALIFSTRSLLTTRRPWRALMAPKTGLRITIPHGLTLRASSRTGAIRVRDLSGDVVLDTERGDIDLDAPCRSLTIVSETGSSDLRGLAGSLSFRSVSGPVNAAWRALPEAGFCDIKTGKGATALRLPPDARLDLRFITGPIAILNEFEHVPESSLKLSITCRAGSIAVRKAASEASEPPQA
jgi:hypothetical protein